MDNHIYLAHHGIKGMKWGVRRFQNADGSLTSAGAKRYSDDQFKRDSSVYGRSGAKRIQKRVEKKGESVSGARSEESRRIHAARRRATVLGTAGSAVGRAGGAIGGAALGFSGFNAVRLLLETRGDSILDDSRVAAGVTATVSAGMSTVGGMLGRDGGRAIGMLTGGYSPEMYRYE